MADRELSIIVRARDLASKAIKGINRELGKTGRIASQSAGHAAKTLATLGTVAAGVAAAGLLASVKAAGEFEAQMNTINTVARRTPEELAAIGKGIRQIARDTGTPLADLTAGFYDLVSAGIDAAQAQRVLASSNRLAIGGLATAAEGVDLITTALNSYGVAAADQGAASERFADVFAKSIERGKVTAAELAASFAQVGPLAASMGISIEELAAGYAQLTAKGVPAAEASTQMRAALIALVRTTGPLEKLQKQTGRNYAAIASKKGLVAAFEQLRKDAKKAGVPLIELVGRQEALQFALGTTGTSLEGYNANLEAMTAAQGTAAAQMSERQKGLNYQLDRLKALALDARITIGTKLLPKLTPLFAQAVNFLNTNQGKIERFGDDIATAFEKAAAWASKVPWGEIGTGLKTGAKFAGDLINAFANLPPQAQATIAALVGLNKLTGGGVIDFGKLAFEQVFSRGASPLNPLWVQQVGATLPGPPGGPPGTSKPSGGGGGGTGGAGFIWTPEIAAIATGTEESKKTLAKIYAEVHGTNLNTSTLAGGGSPDERQARNDAKRKLADIAMQTHRAGEREVQSAAQLKTAVDASKAVMARELATTRREDTRGHMIVAAAERQTAAAVRAKKLSVMVKTVNNLRLTVRDTQQKLTFQQNAAIYG